MLPWLAPCALAFLSTPVALPPAHPLVPLYGLRSPDCRLAIEGDASKTEVVAAPSTGLLSEYNRGLLTVGGITLLFASNSPVIHAAFTVVETPPPALLLNAAASVAALAGLLVGGSLLSSSTELPSTLQESATGDIDRTSITAGAELGLWKTCGTLANLFGLSLTSADHGAFLIQLTTLIVPLVQGLRGVPIPPRVWSAVLLALLGVGLFTQDPAATGSSVDGDALCVLAAVFYATYDLRLFYWGKRVTPLRLITNKITMQSLLSVLALLGFAAFDLASREEVTYVTRVTCVTWVLCLDSFDVGATDCPLPTARYRLLAADCLRLAAARRSPTSSRLAPPVPPTLRLWGCSPSGRESW